MNLMRHRARLSVGATVLAVLLISCVALGYIANKAIWAKATLAEIEPRYARLLGIRAAAETIRHSRSAAETELARYAYPASTGLDRIGTDLQQRLRSIAEQAGIAVSGSQIVAGKTDRGIEEVVVSLNIEIDPAQLNAMLKGVESQTPAIYVDSLVMNPARLARGAAGAGQRVNVQARFSALKVQQ